MVNILKCNNVCISYNRKEVLNDVNLELETNKICSMIGTSGGGKSSILKAIAGFISYEGQISINHEIVTQSDWRRGVVFQDASLFPWLSVSENIIFGLKAMHVSPRERQERCDQLLKLIEMDKYKDNRISTLSGGMKQRVAIARSLATKPMFLLMDEPFGALDSVTRNKMQKFIINIAKQEEIGILIITHDISEALKCGNDVLVLNKNKKNFERFYNPYFGKDISNLVKNNSYTAYKDFKKRLIDYL